MKECLINNDESIVPHEQSAIIANPGNGAFHFPASFISAQLTAILGRFFLAIASMRTNQLNPALFEPLTQTIRVRGRIIDQTLQCLSGITAFPGDLNLLQRLFNQRNFMRSRRVQPASQRKTLAVDHHHPLCPLAPFGLSDGKTPFFAEAKLPSMKLSLQSILPWSSNWNKNCRQMVNHRSCSSQSFNLRQHVLGLGYSSGKSCQRAPVFKIHRIPSSTLRLLLHGLPPFLLRLNFGNNGSIFSHCLSVNNGFRFRAIGSHLRPLFTHITINFRQPFLNFLSAGLTYT